MDRSLAHGWVQEAMKVPKEDADLLRQLESESQAQREREARDVFKRAEEAEKECADDVARAGYQRVQIQALLAAEKVSESRRKMLGLDAPQVVEQKTTHDVSATPAEAKRIMGELFAGVVGPSSEEPSGDT